MTAIRFGLVHAPLTPFTGDRAIDYACYARLIDFHLHHGAEGLALPMHVGESVSLSVEERKALLAFALAQVRGRVPVIVNVSEAGTAIAASLAAHAREAGAAAVIASVPYYWTPPQSMLVEHFAAIGAAAGLPFLVYNAPTEMADVTFSPKSVVDLLQRLPTFAGLIDSSLDWQYMIEVVTVARAVRPDFQFVSGTEYMISAGAIGATGLLSSLSGVAPRLVRTLYDLCRAEKFREARPAQEDAAILFRALRDLGPAGVKAAARGRGRDCGRPRPPLPALDEAQTRSLMTSLSAVKSLDAEPRDWL
ncbi:MAG: dihydrodipicolinate synthase family protein [Rhodoplanes sp.]|uniref:dihydrodipicolinate synthase family protein n=1 Tax=Rhodoplanes sp. TaxID=1968906 RepID=UPI001815AA23|nr:dihydrodipicolinate synthase family protein [Rhodoplanes sp.]NVO17563.1 dihydrodipicolinate synthase family protein [Rhodoplanes sp.]